MLINLVTRTRKPTDEASHWQLLYSYRRFLHLMEVLSEGGWRNGWDLETNN
jgi:hypothetical protein